MWYRSSHLILFLHEENEVSIITPYWDTVDYDQMMEISGIEMDLIGKNIVRYSQTVNQCVAQAKTFSFYRTLFVNNQNLRSP